VVYFIRQLISIAIVLALVRAEAEPCFGSYGRLGESAAGSRRISVRELNMMATEDISRNSASVVDAKLRANRFNLLGSSFYEKDAIYIGVSNSTVEGSHHYYLIAGKKLFDGMPFFSRAKTKEQTGPVLSVSTGVVFKLGVPEELVGRVSDAISKHATSRNLTCFHGVCKVLDEAEIRIEGVGGGKGYRLIPFIRSLASGKVETPGGPASVQMFASSKAELDHFVHAMKTAEFDMAKAGAGFTASEAAAFVIVGTVTLAGAGAAVLGGVIVYRLVVE
jgi:hypothetical protein